MWTRKTFHECANELERLSNEFKTAYVNKFDMEERRRVEILQNTSQEGVALLRTLALSVRSEQDFGEIPTTMNVVGALKSSVSSNEISRYLNSYRPPYGGQPGFQPLSLREALNKIAHANPSKTSFFADENTHDLILCGHRREHEWIAIISIADLCAAIKAIPDQTVQGQ